MISSDNTLVVRLKVVSKPVEANLLLLVTVGLALKGETVSELVRTIVFSLVDGTKVVTGELRITLAVLVSDSAVVEGTLVVASFSIADVDNGSNETLDSLVCRLDCKPEVAVTTLVEDSALELDAVEAVAGMTKVVLEVSTAVVSTLVVDGK